MTGAESEENTHNSLRKLKPKANKNMTCCCIWWPTGFNAVLCLHKASWRNNSNEPSHFIWAKGPFHLSSIKKLNHTANCAPCVFQALQAFQNIIWCMALLNFWEEKRKHFFTGDGDYYWIEWGFNSFKTIIYRKKKKKSTSISKNQIHYFLKLIWPKWLSLLSSLCAQISHFSKGSCMVSAKYVLHIHHCITSVCTTMSE